MAEDARQPSDPHRTPTQPVPAVPPGAQPAPYPATGRDSSPYQVGARPASPYPYWADAAPGPASHDPVQYQPVQYQPVQPDPARHQPASHDPVQQQPTRPDPARHDPAGGPDAWWTRPMSSSPAAPTAPGIPGPGQVPPATRRDEPASRRSRSRSDRDRRAPGPTGAGGLNPVRIGPVRIGPVRIGPVRIGPVRIGPVRIGPGSGDPGTGGAGPVGSGARRAWTVLGIAGAVPLLAALAVAMLLPDPPSAPQTQAPPSRPDQTAASRQSRGTTTDTPSTEATRPSGQPGDLAAVDASVATFDLGRAGVGVQGTVSNAWEWTDGRGRSLLAAISEVTSQAGDGSPSVVSLRVFYVTGLDGKPTVQRRLRDPSLKCSDGGGVVAGYATAAFGVRDLDGDGSPEVMIGWTARCAGPAAVSRVRLAVMSGSKLFVLRGNGVVTGQAAASPATDGNGSGGNGSGGNGSVSNEGAGAPTPVPDGAQWPAGLLDAALATFHSAFY